jgi:SagB-type dehydrogenase family enzyme
VNRIGREFMDKTRYAHLEPSAQSRGLPQPPLERDLSSGKGLIELPEARSLNLERVDLRELLERRRSLRRYAEVALEREELSFLLWSTQGVKKLIPGTATFRTVPSAGARHALETYLLINRVEGFNRGLYWYSALRHALLPLDVGGTTADARHGSGHSRDAKDASAEAMVAACLGQEFVKTSAVTFVWAAEVQRMTWRYGQRGYRYLHLDAGHVCQSLYLAAEAIGCGACAIAAFSDEAMNALLNLDGEDRFAIYVAAVGKR